jgi:hypothetical protein
LGCLTHSVELKELVSVNNLLSLDHEPYPLQKNRIVGVLNRKAYHHHASSVVTLKIYSFCDFPSRNRQENTSSAHVAGLSIVSEALFGLGWVFLFDEDILELNELVHEPTLFPVLEDVLHVYVGRKEAENAVRDNLAQSP